MTNEKWRSSYKNITPKESYGLSWKEKRRIREMEKNGIMEKKVPASDWQKNDPLKEKRDEWELDMQIEADKILEDVEE